MNIHEFQAKALLAGYGIPVPEGTVARSPEEAERAAQALGGARCAVKAQVHAGARAAAGGVRIVASPAEAKAAAAELLDNPLITPQTGAAGKIVRQVYVEQAVDFEREVYLAIMVDRSSGKVALIGASPGGADIEERAASAPDSIRRLLIDPTTGCRPAQTERFAADLGFEAAQVSAAVDVMDALYRAFVEKDASLIEINPLVTLAGAGLLALDIKMSFDDNALFRHADAEALRDLEEVDPSELEAQRHEINYVKLDGSIGCMVNGAGLALATIDLLHQQGGRPADFMDVRPAATRDQVATGFAMLLDNPDVKAILVNVYGGGILRCDTIAEGIAKACRTKPLSVPLIVRAAGTNRELCEQILKSRSVPAVFARTMAEAADRAVAAAGGES